MLSSTEKLSASKADIIVFRQTRRLGLAELAEEAADVGVADDNHKTTTINRQS